jgi:hypothetical protein
MLLDGLDVGEFRVHAAAIRSQWRSASGQLTVCRGGAPARIAAGCPPLPHSSDPRGTHGRLTLGERQCPPGTSS